MRLNEAAPSAGGISDRCDLPDAAGYISPAKQEWLHKRKRTTVGMLAKIAQQLVRWILQVAAAKCGC